MSSIAATTMPKLDVQTPQPVPTHGADGTPAPAGTSVWNLPSGSPARKDDAIDRLDIRVAIGRTMLIGGGAATVLGGAASIMGHGDVGKYGAIAAGVGFLNVIAAAFVAGGYDGGDHNGPYMGALHHHVVSDNPAFDAGVARTTAAASLVGRAADARMRERGLVVDKVLSISTDEAAARHDLVDKPTIDGMLAGKLSGRAVVQLPDRAHGAGPAWALVTMRSANAPQEYPVPPADQREASPPSTTAMLYLSEQRHDTTEVVGKERWIVTSAAPTVLLDETSAAPRSMGQGPSHEVDRQFDGYVTGS